jgi:hypothetical protein
MGIPRGTARLLLDEHRQRPFSGSVLQLGRASIYFTAAELARWARWHGVALRPVGEVGRSHDPRLARQGCLDDRTFFAQLGFDEVRSCDISDWEEADYRLDLNQPIPEELKGRFDVVLDPGSSLQIFHQPILLRNIFELLKVGGRVVHAAVPSNNHVDLGFYMFSPTFFHDFYAANRWRIECEYLCQYFPYWHLGRLHSARWKIYRYQSGCLDHLSYGRFGGRQVAIFAVATRTAEATGDVVPQLGQYVESWQEFDQRREDPEAVAGERAGAAKGATLGARLAAWAERQFAAHPALSRAYLPLKGVKERLRRLLPQRMPPLVARY